MEVIAAFLTSSELAASPWEFGWEALVAIGTLLLALATAYLALRTATLAKTSETEVQAQWRPMILPGSPSRNAIQYIKQQSLLRVRVQNAGRGPALHIRTHLEPGGVSPEHWSLGALAAQDQEDLMFRTERFEPPVQLLFDYRDLAGRTYSTSITLDVVNGDIKILRRSIVRKSRRHGSRGRCVSPAWPT